MVRRDSLTALLVVAFVGCSPAPDTAPGAGPALAPAATGLTAVVSPGPRPNTVAVEYRNGTAKEVVVSEQVIVTNCLALEVTDSTGRVVPPVPPSLPWLKDEGVRIPAGGSRHVEYTLNIFDPPLPPGRYRVRVRIGGWACEPLEYAVVADG